MAVGSSATLSPAVQRRVGTRSVKAARAAPRRHAQRQGRHAEHDAECAAPGGNRSAQAARWRKRPQRRSETVIRASKARFFRRGIDSTNDAARFWSPYSYRASLSGRSLCSSVLAASAPGPLFTRARRRSGLRSSAFAGVGSSAFVAIARPRSGRRPCGSRRPSPYVQMRPAGTQRTMHGCPIFRCCISLRARLATHGPSIDASHARTSGPASREASTSSPAC